MAQKRILICPDTFKGTLSSLGVTQTIRDALLSSPSAASKFTIDVAPMSDGGAGLLDSLLNGCRGLQSVPLADIVGPLGPSHRIATRYAIHREERYAVVEMAEASGLPLVDARLAELNAAKSAAASSSASATPSPLLEKDPRVTTSYGTGQVMAHIANAYAPSEIERVYVGIGGSSTNECGFGALQALGMDIYVRDTSDSAAAAGNNKNSGDAVRRLETPFTGKDLASVVRIDTNTPAFTAFRRRFPGRSIVLLCDVNNPLVGPHGATYIYGPQKGANGQTPAPILDELENGMMNVAAVINAHLAADKANAAQHDNHSSDGASEAEKARAHVDDIGAMPGAGGAGGMSGGLFALLGAQWKAGASVLQDVFLQLDRRIAEADIVISGEGRFDEQTLQYGKTVASIYKTMLRGMGIADSDGDRTSKAVSSADENKSIKGTDAASALTRGSHQKKLFVVVCGLYRGPAMGGSSGSNKAHSPSVIPSLCIPNAVDLHAFPLAPERFTPQLAMTETAKCLRQMVESDLCPFLEGYAAENGAPSTSRSGSCTSHL